MTATSSASTRILIADDHAVVRSGMRTLLEHHGYKDVIEAEDGKEAVEQARQHQPDVVILDVNMPEVDGIEACRRIDNVLPDAHIIILTSYMDDELLFEAVRAGADAYTLKRSGTNAIVGTIERLQAGEEVLDVARITQRFDKLREARATKHQEVFSELTQREVTVLYLITRGMTNQEIADHLDLAPGTIRNYVSSVLSKLEVNNRAEAAGFAAEHNIQSSIEPRYRVN